VLSPEGGPANPASPTSKEATNMPAALVESLFISNVEDAAELRTDAARDAIAHGLSSAILRYLGIAA
jgi:N-acetylmuramoyl-L-alanine amidase